jgi:hypothetical protein
MRWSTSDSLAVPGGSVYRNAVRQPEWDSRWNRPLAFGEIILQPILLPLAVLLYGITEAWHGWRVHVRFLAKTAWSGKTGPYPGVTW